MKLHPTIACRPIVLLAPLFMPNPAEAMTHVPPRSLAELALECDAVARATALASDAIEGAATGASAVSALTRTEFEVLEELSGSLRAGDRILVESPGGEIGDTVVWIPGAPRFVAGETYLLFLRLRADGLWQPAMMSYGVFRQTPSTSGIDLLVPIDESRQSETLPRPDGEPVEPLAPVASGVFLPQLRAVFSGRGPEWDLEASRVSESEVPRLAGGDGGGAAVPAACLYFNDGRNWRWRAYDSTGSTTIYANEPGDPSESAGGFRRIQEGLDLWMGVTGTSVNLLFGGSRHITPNCGGHADFVLFDDPCSDIPDLQGCGGTLAFGGVAVNGTHTFDGATWGSVGTWFVVVNNGAGCLGTSNYRILLAHELGHGLAFNHSEDPNSLMRPSCCAPINATDRTCIRYTYPAADPTNVRPAVSLGPDLDVVLLGNRTRLAATVGDDGKPAGGALALSWRQLTGPGTVRFSAPSSAATEVEFPVSGSYLLGLVADDGELLRMGQVELTVTVFAGGPAPVSFRQGENGYRGAADTIIVEDQPRLSSAGAPELSADGDEPSGSGRGTQVLLRFDDIFGDGPGQLPPGTPIRSARLECASINAGDGAALYRMTAPWDAAATWESFGGDGIQPGDEAFLDADASAADPVIGATSIDVTASVAAWSRRPCANFGWALLPLGNDGWDFYSAEGQTPPRLVVEPAGARVTLIAPGDSWSYFKGTRAPPAGWKDLAFTPGAGWLSGATGIGYDDGDDATVLADMENGYAAIFCRREFVVSGSVSTLTLRIDYDDGFAAYLNGREAARSRNLGAPGTAIAYNAIASSNREAGTPEEHALDPALLVPGKNVLAIEVHNAGIDSSDLSFIPELAASSQLVAGDAEWSFLRGAAAPPADWTSPDFDDAAWEKGRLGIGYGDGDDLTPLEDMEDNYLAAFLRHRFEVADPAALGRLQVLVLHDDGAVLYLNGEEIGRFNMPAGAAGAATAATASIEPAISSVEIPAGALRAGENVLAASIHNSSVDSSDLSFAAVVFAAFGAQAVESCGGFRRGDVNGDDALNISDAVKVLLYLFGGNPTLDCFDAGDADDDGRITITDAARLLDFLFRHGPEPAAPGFACGEDPTDDALGDCESAGCGGG
jgi:hypothetical protein